METSRKIGSVLLITGTAIGAGMLGLPLATASLGFFPAVGLLLFVWFFSFLAGKLILSVTLALPRENLHLNRMAFLTLGKTGQWVSRICVLGLLYALTVAYISGGASIIQAGLDGRGIEVPLWLLETLFTIFLGSFVLFSTGASDKLNRILMAVKAALLIIMLTFCLPETQGSLLQHAELPWLGVAAAIPVLFVSFGFHHIIPSLAQYNQYNDKNLSQALLWGSLLPLGVYVLWLLITLGIVPLTGPLSFGDIPGGDVGPLVETLGHRLQVPSLAWVIHLFANIALITSFIGVTLGLFDFLSDTTRISSQDLKGRLKVGALTFLLPLFFAYCAPHQFIRLLAYGGVFLAIMAFILPGLMALKLKICGKLMPVAVILFGIGVAILGVL